MSDSAFVSATTSDTTRPEYIIFIIQLIFQDQRIPKMFRLVLKTKALMSVAVLAEIPLRLPQKILNYIIKKKICWVKVSKNNIIYF